MKNIYREVVISCFQSTQHSILGRQYLLVYKTEFDNLLLFGVCSKHFKSLHLYAYIIHNNSAQFIKPKVIKQTTYFFHLKRI